jgi:hypothetical protein
MNVPANRLESGAVVTEGECEGVISTLDSLVPMGPTNECNVNHADLPSGDPCPSCGAVTVHATGAITANVTIMSYPPTIGIGYNPEPPWQELWRSVLQRHDELIRCSTGELDSSDSDIEWRRIPLAFCHHCWNLKDRLKKDVSVSVPDDTIEKYAIKSFAIGRAGDVSNTEKHSGRNDPKYTVAVVAEMIISPTRERTFRIDWTEPSKRKGSILAHDLATDAIAEWHAFFSTHGLDDNA